jgi:hypothetical protein
MNESKSTRILGVRKGAKMLSSQMRLLDLDNAKVVAAHKKFFEFMAMQEITNVNITDVSETYVAALMSDSDIAVHRQSPFEGETIVKNESSLGFRVAVDEDNQLSKVTQDNLTWLKAHGQSVDEKYYNDNTMVTIAFADKGLLVANQHPKSRHRCSGKWPKRSFGADVAGKYVDAVHDVTVHFNRKGDFANQLVTEHGVTQLFSKV